MPILMGNQLLFPECRPFPEFRPFPDFVSDPSVVFTEGHYNDVIMNTMASQTTSLTIVYSTVYSGVDEKKHQSSASLAFVRGIQR